MSEEQKHALEEIITKSVLKKSKKETLHKFGVAFHYARIREHV